MGAVLVVATVHTIKVVAGIILDKAKQSRQEVHAFDEPAAAVPDSVCCIQLQPEDIAANKQQLDNPCADTVIIDAEGFDDSSDVTTAALERATEAHTEEAELQSMDHSMRSSLLSDAATLLQHLAMFALTMGVIAVIWPVILVIFVLAFLALPVATELQALRPVQQGLEWRTGQAHAGPSQGQVLSLR